ncbi:MAG: hypothetical protein WDA27_09880 [Actinomycetota bacterium]
MRKPVAVFACAVLLTGCQQSGPTLSTSSPPDASQFEVAVASSPQVDRSQRLCEGEFVSKSGAVRFTCPQGWWIWMEGSGPGNALAVILSNRQEGEGGESLPEGQFKIDVHRGPNADFADLDDVERDCLANRDDVSARVVYCRRVEIAGVTWIRYEKIGYSGALEMGMTTLFGDTVLGFWAGIAEGSEERGRHEVGQLLQSVRVA